MRFTGRGAHRFELERTAVESLGQMVEPGHAAQLSLVVELMATLHWQLDQDIPEQARRRFALWGKEEAHHDV